MAFNIEPTQSELLHAARSERENLINNTFNYELQKGFRRS